MKQLREIQKNKETEKQRDRKTKRQRSKETGKQRGRETKRLRVSEVVGRSDGHNYKFKRKERYIIGQKTKCKDTMIQ